MVGSGDHKVTKERLSLAHPGNVGRLQEEKISKKEGPEEARTVEN